MMSNIFRTTRIFLLVLIVAGVSGCVATELREHNIQLEALLNIRADAREKVRQARADESLRLLEEERRLIQTHEDLASLAADVAADVDNVSENETKVSYLFTAARAGSKTTGPILAEAFAARIEEGKKKDAEAKEAAKEAASETGEDAVSGPTIAEDDPVSPFYFGIVVPGRTICNGFTNDWERPARDCAFLSVVAYFVAVDEVVAKTQELETMRNGKVLTAADADAVMIKDYHDAIDGLSRQFGYIDAESKVIQKTYQVATGFKAYLDTQMFRTFCSADLIRAVLDPGAGAASQLNDDQATKVANMLTIIEPKLKTTLTAYVGAGPYDCGAAPKS